MGGPIIVARPRNMVSNPKALVSLSRPRTSTRTMEVRVISEAMQTPNMRLGMMNSVKVGALPSEKQGTEF